MTPDSWIDREPCNPEDIEEGARYARAKGHLGEAAEMFDLARIRLVCEERYDVAMCLAWEAGDCFRQSSEWKRAEEMYDRAMVYYEHDTNLDVDRQLALSDLSTRRDARLDVDYEWIHLKELRDCARKRLADSGLEPPHSSAD